MKLVRENINFERGLDPKDAMGIGDVEIRRKHLLQKYYDIIAASNLFVMEPFNFPEFSFKSKEELGPNSTLCTNDLHYGEHAEYTLVYDAINDNFFLLFDNNGYDMDIKSLSDLKINLGLNDLKENINFKRGIDPKEAMKTGIYSMSDQVQSFFDAIKVSDGMPDPGSFPWCFYFLKNKSGLCYMYGIERWLSASFLNITKIKETETRPEGIISISKDYLEFLKNNGVNFDQDNLEIYDKMKRNLNNKYNFDF